MKKSKSSSSDDRLSNLPDSLIFEIFWFLPITDVVRTTILSKRWKDMWITAPFLNIDGYGKNTFRNFINRALIVWRGVKLLKFKIKLKSELTRPLVRDIGVWLRFAKEKQVQELHLDLPYSKNYNYDFEFLYSCSSLKVLWLRSCRLQIVGNVKWDRLESLRIHGSCLDEDAIAKVLCGSPKLEVILWTFRDSEKKVCIRSSSLKKLSIENSCESWLEIRTPNLERLEISGIPFGLILLNVSSLTDVTLGFYNEKECNVGDLDWFSWQRWFKDLPASELVCPIEALKQILPAIQGVERVTLSNWCVKVLGAMNKNCVLSPFLNVKFLKLKASFSNHKRIAGLLRIFPELKSLVIEDMKEDSYQYDQEESLKFEANLPNSFLMQLTTVDVTWAKGGYAVLSFIEIILKYASKLEKMVFRVKTITKRHSASQKLLRMPRSSPTAQLIFCEY